MRQLFRGVGQAVPLSGRYVAGPLAWFTGIGDGNLLLMEGIALAEIEIASAFFGKAGPLPILTDFQFFLFCYGNPAALGDNQHVFLQNPVAARLILDGQSGVLNGCDLLGMAQERCLDPLSLANHEEGFVLDDCGSPYRGGHHR